jgi:tetratricopeptide (TPR) repeat protein
MRNVHRAAAFLGILLVCGFGTWLLPQSEGGGAIFEKNKTSVIFVMAMDEDKMEIDRGTGFVIGQNLMVTNYHLLSEAKNAEGLDINGKKVKIEGIISFDLASDLAVVKIKSKAPTLTPTGFETVKFGSELFVVGCNEAGQVQSYEGKIINLVEYAPGKLVADTSIQAPETASGAPVFDENGVVVGVLTYLDSASKFVLPGNLVSPLNTSAKPTKFKSQDPVEYLSSEEGIFLASRLFGAVESTSKAVRYLKDYLKIKPDHLETYQILARMETKQRNFAAAVESYKKIQQLSPDDASAFLGLGQVYVSMMKWPDAIAPLEQAVQMNPEYTQAFQLIGQSYREQRMFDKAIPAYESYLATEPQAPGESHYELGECYKEMERFADAVRLFQQSVQIDPQSIIKNTKLAEAMEEAGMIDEAAARYEELARLSPDDAKIYLNIIVRIFDEADMPDKAVAAAQKMVDLDPENPEAYYNLGIMLTNQKRLDEAVAAMTKAIELNPGFDFAYLNLGNVYYQQKNYKEAIPIFEKLVEIVPDNAQGWLFLGICNMQLKRWDPAVGPLQKVVELEPQNGNAYYNLAIAYLNLKDNASAREIYNQLRNLDPSLAQRLSKYIR